MFIYHLPIYIGSLQILVTTSYNPTFRWRRAPPLLSPPSARSSPPERSALPPLPPSPRASWRLRSVSTARSSPPSSHAPTTSPPPTSPDVRCVLPLLQGTPRASSGFWEGGGSRKRSLAGGKAERVVRGRVEKWWGGKGLRKGRCGGGGNRKGCAEEEGRKRERVSFHCESPHPFSSQPRVATLVASLECSQLTCRPMRAIHT